MEGRRKVQGLFARGTKGKGISNHAKLQFGIMLSFKYSLICLYDDLHSFLV